MGKSIIYLTVDHAKIARDRRLAEIAALQAAELERSREWLGTLVGLSDDDARRAIAAQYPPDNYRCGNDHNSFPFTLLYATLQDERFTLIKADTTQAAACGSCGATHPQLYTIRRQMCDTFGHFPCYRINGSIAVVDGTLPYGVDRLPRDAEPVAESVAARLWHSSSHYFGH